MLSLFGCASAYKCNEFHGIEAGLNPYLGVLISVPENGWYGNTEYKKSGVMTANSIRAAFLKNAAMVDISEACKGDSCLNEIDSKSYGYYVKPTILHWEERATEWSGKPDRIEIQIVVYDSTTKNEIANTSFTGKSKWATFGGDHPQDLLPEPTNNFVSSLYH
jgi:hypothetical protein